jgi:DNA-binding MarR family transcriptional regulator
MNEPTIESSDKFRLRSGTEINAGWLRQDLHFLTRSLRFLLQGESAALRADTGLETGEFGVLAVVSLNPGISQNELADSLVLKKSAVTRVVQGLEKRGYLTRRRSKNDRRAKRLTLTREGQELADALRKMSLDRQIDWFSGIPAEERAVFFRVLFELIATMAEAVADKAPIDEGDVGRQEGHCQKSIG